MDIKRRNHWQTHHSVSALFLSNAQISDLLFIIAAFVVIGNIFSILVFKQRFF